MNTAKQNIEKLPGHCYSTDNVTGEIIKILSGVSGFYKQENYSYIRGLIKSKELELLNWDYSGEMPEPSEKIKKQARELVAEDLNKDLGVTPAQQQAMETGSMFGWEVPGADPDNYNEEGLPYCESRPKPV